MRSAGNFHPEWGYLAPAPSFMRTVRIALVATTIGATAGAIVVVSLVERPGSNNDNSSIAAHALVTSAPVIAAPAAAGPLKINESAAAAAAQQSPQRSAEAPAPTVTSTPMPSAVPTANKVEADPSAAVVASAPIAAAEADSTPAAADADAAATDATVAKKPASKKHRYEAARRWQSANNAKKRWRDNRGLGPLLRLFSFRAGSSYSSN